MTMKRIYMDSASTTKLSETALRAMSEAYRIYGNPSSLHSEGAEALSSLQCARRTVARCLGAEADEIYFTSGGTEANNTALKGIALSHFGEGGIHIVSTAIEHPSVLNSLVFLKRFGVEHTLVPVTREGYVRPCDIESAIRENTVLVSVMYANNEIGTIQPVADIASVCHRHGVLFHTDAVQAAGHISLDVVRDGVDLMSISAHKFHGPKGIGALYVKSGVSVSGVMSGGGQEKGVRAGTQAPALAVGMAAALDEACENMKTHSANVRRIRDKIIAELLKMNGAHINGGLSDRLDSNISVRFDGIDGEALVIGLDMRGIAVSSGSACSSGLLEPSHVMLAIGIPPEQANGSLRISLGDDVTADDADQLLTALHELVTMLAK